MSRAFPAIHPDLHDPLAEALRQLGDASPIRSANLLDGGCINHAICLQTGQGQYLLKWNNDPPPVDAPVGMPAVFQAEASGLRRLADTHTIRVPEVLFVGAPDAGCPPFILLEWLSGAPENAAALEVLGAQVAELHRQGTAPAYGLDGPNYLGFAIQHNTWSQDWLAFFTGQRLRPQMEWARRLGRLPTGREHRLERLIERLPDFLGGVERRPALVHGDLWGGNIVPSPDGLALIDPAISFSDRETELAYTEMFGRLPEPFYAGYQSAWPLEPGYAQRRDLYNLYHLINHLNHFGETYGQHVDRVLHHYLG